MPPVLASNAVQACLNALASYLAGSVRGLTVYKEWPTANQQLLYPSVTLFSGQVKRMNLMPEEVSVSTPDGDGKVVQTLYVGEFDFKLQMDLWTANKLQRDTVMGLLEDAINAAETDGTGLNNPAGLSIQLNDYFGEWARFDMDGFMYVDDEAAAERQERRVKIDLLVNCRAIKQRTLYAIANVETHVGVGTDSTSEAATDTSVVP